MKETEPMHNNQKKSVRIEEADNGYTVSMYVPSESPEGMGHDKVLVHATLAEAMASVKKMMGGGKMDEMGDGNGRHKDY